MGLGDVEVLGVEDDCGEPLRVMFAAGHGDRTVSTAAVRCGPTASEKWSWVDLLASGRLCDSSGIKAAVGVSSAAVQRAPVTEQDPRDRAVAREAGRCCCVRLLDTATSGSPVACTASDLRFRVPSRKSVPRSREIRAKHLRGRASDLGVWISRIPHEGGGCAVRCA